MEIDQIYTILFAWYSSHLTYKFTCPIRSAVDDWTTLTEK